MKSSEGHILERWIPRVNRSGAHPVQTMGTPSGRKSMKRTLEGCVVLCPMKTERERPSFPAEETDDTKAWK